MRLTEEAMQERRVTIIRKAIDLFCQRGIEVVKLSEIAEASHVSENTIYRYFDTKENLVREVFLKLWDNVMVDIEQDVESTTDYFLLSGYEQIRAWLDGFRVLYQHGRYFVLFAYEAKLYLLRHNIKLEKSQQDILVHAIREPCIAALEKGKRDGSILSKEDSEDLFFTIWGAIRGYIIKIVVYDELYLEENPWERRYQTLEQVLLRALTTE